MSKLFSFSQADADHLHWIFSVPVGITLCLIGLIGNAISICAWYRITKTKRGNGKATGIYLITLGIVSSGLLFFFLITDSLPASSKALKNNYAYASFFSYFGLAFFFFFTVASIWIIVGVTVTRFIMIKFPVKAKDWCSTRRAYIGITATLVSVFIIILPHFFTHRPVKVKDGYTYNLTKYGSSEFAQMYKFWVHCMVMDLVPWITIAILNSIIIHVLISRTKYMRDLDRARSIKRDRNKQDGQMTRVLLTVTFTFLLLLALPCITQCFFILGDGKEKSSWSHDAVNLAFPFAKMGLVINSAITCFLYCFTGSVFRAEVKKMFGFSHANISSNSTSFKMQRGETTDMSAESKA